MLMSAGLRFRWQFEKQVYFSLWLPCYVLNYFIIFFENPMFRTLYSCHGTNIRNSGFPFFQLPNISRTSRRKEPGNLQLRNFRLLFVAWRKLTPRFTSLPERGKENIKYFISPNGNRTQNRRFHSQTVDHCATLTSFFIQK